MADKMKPAGKRLGLFNSLILAGNLVFVTGLLLAYLSSHISPHQNNLLPFFGLLYPYMVIINLFLIVYWVIRRRWLFLISTLAILIGWNHIERTVQVFNPADKSTVRQSFKIITYNVKNLSNDNVDLLEPEVRENIINYIDSQDPDIICLQEFSIVHPDPNSFLDSLSAKLNMPYHAYSLYIEQVRKRLNAIYIFSKFPVIAFNSLRKDNLHNYALFADMVVGTDTIRVYNVHLESIRLRHEDYKFISDIDLQLDKSENVKEGYLRIFKKMKGAYERRATQADSLASCIASSPYPVILCGDFNDSPNSYVYQELTRGLTDAFLESGKGFGNTYAGKLPSYRIDYILYSDFFTSGDWNRDRVVFSDHYPVSCQIGIKDN